MAKQLGTFELVIRGTESAPTACFRRYTVQESTEPTLNKHAEAEDGSPDFNKTLHNAGSVGEFWKDAIDAVKTAEGI